MAGRFTKSAYRLKKICPFLFSALAFCSSPVFAHDFWILPHDSVTEVNSKVIFELRIGPGWPGKQTPRLPGLIDTFNAWDQSGSQKVQGHDGALVIGHIKIRQPGATIAALTTNGAKITLPADEFEEYLKEEGLNKIIKARHDNDESQLPGTELFYRCAKALIIVDNQSTGFNKTIGLERELVAETEPLHYTPGTRFTVKLLASGVPLAGIQVKAELNTVPPTILREVTDKNGRVNFVLPQKGEWLFSAVDMDVSPIEDADWKSIWASLTIPVAGGDSA